ncbi:MAG TPA: hypothetical protein VNW52_04300 [Burkholderiaceae bacterium]|jgi:hypothetical protein|nr:hypothetical protein [Burkholderiaceae bacterium]
MQIDNNFTRPGKWAFLASRIAAAFVMLTGAMNAGAIDSGAWGSHGMAIFGGRDGLYASHLPMFHAPHDAQVILRFHLRDAANDVALRKELARKPELWTLDPEAFDLHRLTPATDTTSPDQRLTQFTARIVQGHFERHGHERYAQQTVIVDEVLVYRTLAPEMRTHSDGHYYVLGRSDGREHFLVKEIDRRPDFDVILALKPTKADVVKFPAMLTLPTDDLQAPTARTLRTALHAQIGADAALAHTLYFETDDLK